MHTRFSWSQAQAWAASPGLAWLSAQHLLARLSTTLARLAGGRLWAWHTRAASVYSPAVDSRATTCREKQC